MIKIQIFLTRRSDLSHEEFSRYWLETHAPKITGLPEAQENLQRYVQQVATENPPKDLPIASYDGIAELWFDTLDAGMETMNSDNYKAAIPVDEPNFIDQSKTKILITEERQIM